MQPTIPRLELKRTIKRFLTDKNRGISIPLFAELCGVSVAILRLVFIKEEEPLTEYVQRRVSKGYQSWVRGEVAVMMNRDQTRFVQYRKEAKPKVARSMGLEVQNGQIKLRIGLKNKADYSNLDIDEQLRR
jgi:hypothetical protein